MTDFDTMTREDLIAKCVELTAKIDALYRVVDGCCDLTNTNMLDDGCQAVLQRSYGSLQFDNGLYTGETVLGKANGQGSCEFSDGSKYEGKWLRNKMHGRGIMIFGKGGEGEKYEGEFKENVYNGKGVYSYKHGQTYEGDYKDGHRNGRGALRWDEGQSGYVGDWLEGKRCGYGMCQYQDGDRYYGEWSDDRWHGKGVKYEEETGVIWIGNFEFDQLHGSIKKFTLPETIDYYRNKVIARKD